jgi:TetR/AcrR family transcriptional regulator, repressor for uid operon
MGTPALAVLARALDPEVGTPHDATSERILDAALALSAASGLRHLTMDDVARRAGVGRMTVYRRFSDRDGLVDALVVRETRRCLAALDGAADAGQPIADQVAAGFVTSLRLATEHPLLARLARVEPEVVLEFLNTGPDGVFGAAVAFLSHRLRESQDAGVLPRGLDVDVATELLVRLAFSFVLVPRSGLPLDDDDRLRAIARAHLAPLLDSKDA